VSEKKDLHSRIVGYIGAVTGLLGLTIAMFAYCHQVNESEARRETVVGFDASYYWESVFVDEFVKERVGPGAGFSWSDEIYDYYGLNVYVIAKIYNAGEQSVSIDDMFALHTINGWGSRHGELHGCYESDRTTETQFPLFVEPHQQARVFIRVNWPVDEGVSRILARLAPGCNHAWDEVVNLYQSSVEEPLSASVSGGPPSYYLWLLAKHRLQPQRIPAGTPEHQISVCAKLATGEKYWARIDHL